jgi:hypothetical protein
MEKKPQPGFGIRDEHPGSYFLELSLSFLRLKILRLFDTDPDPESGILPDPGSGINIPDPQHCQAPLSQLPQLSISSLCCRYAVYNIHTLIHTTQSLLHWLTVEGGWGWILKTTAKNAWAAINIFFVRFLPTSPDAAKMVSLTLSTLCNAWTRWQGVQGWRRITRHPKTGILRYYCSLI